MTLSALLFTIRVDHVTIFIALHQQGGTMSLPSFLSTVRVDHVTILIALHHQGGPCHYLHCSPPSGWNHVTISHCLSTVRVDHVTILIALHHQGGPCPLSSLPLTIRVEPCHYFHCSPPSGGPCHYLHCSPPSGWNMSLFSLLSTIWCTMSLSSLLSNIRVEHVTIFITLHHQGGPCHYLHCSPPSGWTMSLSSLLSPSGWTMSLSSLLSNIRVDHVTIFIAL